MFRINHYDNEILKFEHEKLAKINLARNVNRTVRKLFHVSWWQSLLDISENVINSFVCANACSRFL